MSRNVSLPTLYSIREIADHLKVSDKTVRRWIDQGRLPVHRIGRQLRISEPDFDAFIRTHREG